MKSILPLLLAAILLGACNTDTATGDPAAAVVERYLTAKIESDEAVIRQLICSEMEAEITRETASFASVDAEIEEMVCSGDGDRVRCTGKIVATYGTEDREFPLASYRVVQEDGEWRWCGEG